MDRTAEGERRLIVSKEASLRESGRNKISIDLKDAFVQMGKENSRDNYDYATSSMLTYSVSQEDAVQAVYSPGAREMSSVDVAAEIVRKEDALGTNVNREKKALARNAFALENTLRQGTAGRNWNRLRDIENDFSASLAAVTFMKRDMSLIVFKLEFYKKFTIPFGAFSFVFVAVTLGLMAKKNGQTVGFLIGIIISVLYWAMLLGGQTLGTRGISPFWSMWTPNFLALGAGLVLLIIRLRN
jgi:lipopolysaccharide export system permease protein